MPKDDKGQMKAYRKDDEPVLVHYLQSNHLFVVNAALSNL